MENEIAGILTRVEQIKAQLTFFDGLASDREELHLHEDGVFGLGLFVGSIRSQLEEVENRLANLPFGTAEKERPARDLSCSEDDLIIVDPSSSQVDELSERTINP